MPVGYCITLFFAEFLFQPTEQAKVRLLCACLCRWGRRRRLGLRLAVLRHIRGILRRSVYARWLTASAAFFSGLLLIRFGFCRLGSFYALRFRRGILTHIGFLFLLRLVLPAIV